MGSNRKISFIGVAGSFFLSGCVGPALAVSPRPSSEEVRESMNLRAESAAVPRLVQLVDDRRLQTINPDDYNDTALKDILKLTTPEGYRIKYRFLEIGVPVAQGLSLSQDQQLFGRLLETARFESGRRARSESLLVLAARKNPDHLKIFKEALLDRDVAVQFAAVEALGAWGLPEALPLLLDASERNWSPLIRVFAAQMSLRLGAPQGRAQLKKFLLDKDWLMRAMAARYLGDLGEPNDLDLLLDRMGRERDHPYVLAEICLSGLKLWTRRGPILPKQESPPPINSPRAPAKVSSLFELEPLVVTAPRLRVSGSQLVPAQIDNELVNLLEKIATEPLPEEVLLDPVLVEIKKLVTPQGFGLYVRYTDISFLLTEGLAGTSNLTLVNRLETIARSSPNTPVRGSAFVALGHDVSRIDLSLFERALQDRSLQVRFGVVEGLAAQTNPMARGMLAGAAQTDPSLVVRLFAAQALGRRGDAQGVDLLRRYLTDPDWVIRSLATYFLGQLGDDADFERFLINLTQEQENHVVAENCLAVLRMSR